MDNEPQVYGLKELPPFSVPVPDHPDWYIRFTTHELADLCKKLGSPNPLQLLEKLDGLDLDAIHYCWRIGRKKITEDRERVEEPRWEAMPATLPRNLILDAICLRLFGKTNAQLQDEAAARAAGMVKPWTDGPDKPAEREPVTLDDVSGLG